MADLEENLAQPTSEEPLLCSVVTPEATIAQVAARFVALPLADGEIGIAPGHTPLIGRLGYGELRIKQANLTVRYYVDGGFVEVLNNEISILTNRAVPAVKLETDVAEELLKEALAMPANTPELLAQRERLQLQARAQLRVARHAYAGLTAGAH
ncbi:MAG TPA: ATP synthase F1 subunit epsilon [Pirellulales bacterium]|jgi:F-type H+-transporting ATPase subunit epsilon|nr:ATP synthase F1 subunit epsilon [Pirellulales bacterium]